MRFASVEDEDFQSVVSHLKVWIGNCQEAVTLSWGTQKAAAQYLIEKRNEPPSFSYIPVILTLQRERRSGPKIRSV